MSGKNGPIDLFWCYIKQIMNVFVRAIANMHIWVIRWKMKFSISITRLVERKIPSFTSGKYFCHCIFIYIHYLYNSGYNDALNRHACSSHANECYVFKCFTDITVDINECELFPCHLNGICNNTDGSFNCVCKQGFLGDGFKCDGK